MARCNEMMFWDSQFEYGTRIILDAITLVFTFSHVAVADSQLFSQLSGCEFGDALTSFNAQAELVASTRCHLLATATYCAAVADRNHLSGN